MRSYLVITLLLVSATANAQPDPDAPAETPSTPPPPPTSQSSTPPPEIPPTPLEACRERRRELSSRASKADTIKERTRLLQSMPDCAHPELMPAVDASSSNEAPHAVDSAESFASVSGFAIEMMLQTTLAVNNSAVLAQTEPGVFLGYRNRSVTLGVGVSVERLSTSTTAIAGPSSDASQTSFLVMPGIRIPLATAGRAEILGQVDAGYGQISQSGGTAMTPPSLNHYRFQIAPALRYWVASAFAVGATAGIRYDLESQDNAGVNMSLSTTGLFTSLQLTGVF